MGLTGRRRPNDNNGSESQGRSLGYWSLGRPPQGGNVWFANGGFLCSYAAHSRAAYAILHRSIQVTGSARYRPPPPYLRLSVVVLMRRANSELGRRSLLRGYRAAD